MTLNTEMHLKVGMVYIMAMQQRSMDMVHGANDSLTISGEGEAVDKISVTFQSLVQSPIAAVIYLM